MLYTFSFSFSFSFPEISKTKNKMSVNIVTEYLTRVKNEGDIHYKRVRNEKIQEFITNNREQLNTFFPPERFPDLMSPLLQSDTQFKLETPWEQSQLYKQFRDLTFDIDVRTDPPIPSFPQETVEIQVLENHVRFIVSEKTTFPFEDLPPNVAQLSTGVHVILFEDACEMYSKMHNDFVADFEESLKNACVFMHLDKIRELAARYNIGDIGFTMAVNDIVRANKELLGKERMQNMLYSFLVAKHKDSYDDSDLRFISKVY